MTKTSFRKPILIASDHAGIELKSAIKAALTEWSWQDLGPMDASRVDYPDYAFLMGRQFLEEVSDQGILICGSGIGMSIAANKVPGIRAAVVENPVSARLSREHNDANILCLGSRFLAPAYAAEIARIWLDTPFSKDERHLARIRKIRLFETEI